jgi:hypothetical protein
MWGGDMANSWDELKASGAILAPGKRKSKPKVETVKAMKEPLKCANCGKPVAIKILDHCKCSIWEVGKRKDM